MAREYFGCPRCGRPIEVEGRNRADARRKAKWLAESGRICSVCRREEIAAQSARDAAESAAEGLPPLEGSEAQARWAETVRRDVMRRLDEGEDRFVGEGRESGGEEGARLARGAMIALRGILENEVRASVWLDVRAMSLRQLATHWEREIREALSDGVEPGVSDVPEDVLEEALMRPENPASTVPAEICADNGSVVAVYDRDERFISVVKSLHYGWRSCKWRFSVPAWAGPMEDRLAELAANLLKAGFVVRCMNAEARRRVLSGEWKPMTYRWIVGLPKKGRIGLICEGEDVYERVKGTFWLTGNRGPMSVRFEAPPERYDAVMEIAEKLSFRVTDGARAMMAAAKARVEGALLVRDVKVHEAPAVKAVPDLDDFFDVVDDLKDE